MKVSLITVCYNSAKTIRDTIESVITQDYSDIEYIIIDGNSKDKTLDIIKEYRENISYFSSENDRGLWDAMNKGIAVATGDFIGFINSDDFYAKESVISEMVSLVSSDEFDAVHAYIDIVDKDNTDTVIRRYRVKNFSKTSFRFGLMPAHPGFLAKKSFFDKYGSFTLSSNEVAPDFELMVRFMMRGGMRSVLYPSVAIKMRNEGESNRSFFDRIKRVKLIIRSCRVNSLYTNIFLVMAKFPYKVYEYMRLS
jgi:glycosyltransferase involved in cell wall biosynthesis